MDEALSGLDAVAWAGMKHAHGDASDLPALLRTALTASLASERRDARHSLWDRLQTQGSIHESTAHLIPFLARTIGLAREDDRAALASMLGQLAYGRHEKEKGWVTSVRRASWDALEPLLALLESEDEDLLVQVPFALVALVEGARDGAPAHVHVPRTAERIADAIGARATQPATPKALTGFAFALGALARRVPVWAGRLGGALSGGAALPVRCAIAIELAPIRDRAAIWDTLIEALRARGEHDTWVPYPFPWRSGHLRFSIVERLSAHAPDEAFERALPTIAEILRTESSPSTFEREALPALVRALDGVPIAPGARRSDLPRAASVVLDALYDNPSFWSEPWDADRTLRPLGLEPQRAAWTVLLER